MMAPTQVLSKDRDFQKYLLTAVALTAVAIIFLIILFTAGNSIDAIKEIGILNFLTEEVWDPSDDRYGALPLILGTLLTTAGAMAIALPLGLGSAILLSEVVSEKTRNILKPICEVFAGIPSVVYGFFGLVVIVPLLLEMFPEHLSYGSSWLAGSILLGVMALPTVISVSDDAMRSVPKHYREASVAMGATGWETTRKVIIPAAISGISAAVILGVGRAIGETMAVMMVTGNAAIIPDPLWNIFSLLKTMTSTLALEMGEVAVGDIHYSALFLLALVLMAMVLMINFAARIIVKRTEKKLNGDLSSTWIPDKVGSMMERIRTPFLMSIVFVFMWMMSSLFFTSVMSAAIALLAVLMISASSVISKRIGSRNRERIVHHMLYACAALVLIILAAIIGDIAVKGASALSVDFLTGVPSNSGREGGILPAILGTLELVAGTAVIALPLGILSGIYLAEYSGDGKVTAMIRNAIDLLNGTPSIVFGLFGMTFIVIYLGVGTSLLAGCVTLGLLVLPVIIRTTEESVKAVPMELREASMAMGVTKWMTIWKVVIPAAMGGLLTGTILSLGRAAGETAPIMFTAAVISQRTIGFSLFEPIMALPYHLYYLAAEVPGSTDNQYGTALVLMIIVLAMFLSASVIRHHYSKKVRW